MRKLRFSQVQGGTGWCRGGPQHTVAGGRSVAAQRPAKPALEEHVVCLILLHGGECFSRQAQQDAPELIEHDGICYSLRAGPRAPLNTEGPGDPVAVYAPDHFNEEEFQNLYASARPHVAEFNLSY